MPIQQAMNFIHDAGSNKDLRSSLYKLGKKEIFPYLEKKGYKFTMDEFEESTNLLHVKCQTEEEANLLFEVIWWFKMILQQPQPETGLKSNH